MSKEEIKNNIAAILSQEPFKSEIKKASLFGSYTHGEFSDDSDIDLLVEFKPTVKMGYFGMARLQDKLENTVGKKVDLLTPQALSKYFRDKVLEEAEVIYEG